MQSNPKNLKLIRKTERKIRKELKLRDDEFLLGIIGQITPRKGQLELIKTFAENQKRLPNATLLIVGAPMFNQDHDYLEELKQTIKDLRIEEKVRFLGQRKDVSAIMQAIDVLVVNSKSEALVVVAIEAMACGTPVIATDVGGTREMIENDINGWLVPFGDSEKLADALAECAAEPEMRRAFAIKNQQIVDKHFSAEKFIREIEDFFRHEVSERKVRQMLSSVES